LVRLSRIAARAPSPLAPPLAPQETDPSTTRPTLRWWRELLTVVGFYAAYTVGRDIHGPKPVSEARAFHDAGHIIAVERWLHIFDEQRVQAWFLHDHLLIRLLDDYYGTVHFLAVAGVLVLLYHRYPQRYALWRNALAATTALALVGFVVFPVMPPRLMPASFHFVDTLRVVGGIWNFDSAPVNAVSNQFAAMPSLHTAWSAWCALALIPLIRPLWGRILAALYPAVTVFSIVVTANHYFADAFGGLVVLAVGLVGALLVSGDARRVERPAAPADAPASG
jgi:hypothetical protein